jgi:hypothetical protein
MAWSVLDGAVLNQGVIVLAGIFWAMTAISYRRKHAGAGTGGREATVPANRRPALMRWGKAATYAAVLLPLPYGITRLAWALGVPLGIDQAGLLSDLVSGRERHGEGHQGRAGGRAQVPAGLAVDHGRRLRRPAVRPAVGAVAAMGAGGRPAPRMPAGRSGMGALLRRWPVGRLLGRGPLTIGLVRPWGEVLPRWIPLVGGRTVPVRAAVTVAGLGTIFIFGVYAYALLNPIFRFRVPPDEPIRRRHAGTTRRL